MAQQSGAQDGVATIQSGESASSATAPPWSRKFASLETAVQLAEGA